METSEFIRERKRKLIDFFLKTILDRHGITHIDYLSIDTEGNELSILKTIDFEKFDIEIIDVENNYNSPDIRNFLKSKGYQLKKKLSVGQLLSTKVESL